MQDDKGHCYHGELLEGCPKCIEERQESLIRLEHYLNPEGLTPPMAETALTTNPRADAEFISYYNEALKLQKYAESRVILTAEDLKPATDDLSILARLKKSLEEKRKECVKPLQDHVKEINDAFKIFMMPIEQADTITREKILAFQLKQKLIREGQEKINQLRLEAAEKQKRLTGEIIDVDLVEVAPEVSKRIRTEMGTAGQRDNWKWEVTNINLVPREYFIINAGMLTPIVKASKGKIVIPGIRIYNEPIIAVNTK